MNPPQRYGKLDKPEEQSHIEVVEGPVTVFRAAHNLFTHQINLKNMNESWVYDNDACDEVHAYAGEILKPRAKMFSKVSNSDLEKICSIAGKSEFSGIFLSALLNETELPCLYGVFKYKVLGHNLAPGKILVALPDSKVKYLGTRSEGTLLNYGKSGYICYEQKSGICLNFGKTDNLCKNASGDMPIGAHFGDTDKNSKDFAAGAYGIFVNYSPWLGDVSKYCTGGLHINFKSAKSFACQTDDGIRVNSGYAEFLGKTAINFGTVAKHSHTNPEVKNIDAVKNAVKEFGEKFKALSQFKGMTKDNMPNLVSFDWKGFKEDVLSKSKELEAVLK